MFSRLHAAMAEMDGAIRVAATHQVQPKELLRLNMPHVAARLVIGPALAGFMAQYSDIRLVHQSQPIVGAISEQMLHPRPALAQGIQDYRRTGAVGDVCGRQVHHQQAAVGVDGDKALAPDHLVVRVVTPCFCRHGFDRLAVDDAGTRARFPPAALAV